MTGLATHLSFSLTAYTGALPASLYLEAKKSLTYPYGFNLSALTLSKP